MTSRGLLLRQLLPRTGIVSISSLRPAISQYTAQYAAPLRQFSTEAASHPSSKTQVYISHSRDPLLNLSVEHHLLQTSPSDSTILLLYINKPCIVFGRNQNPWLETNLSRLAARVDEGHPVQLVRRRSGGGTVFHDEGNVNFSVICPPASFDRNKHAEMVVRALRKLGRPTTRVNERHDIVIDDPQDTSKTFKVSGSAYKLTRLRSLHHGTCLLNSPNLRDISTLLRSPAEPFIKARGVDSVRSSVRNLDLDLGSFEDAVVDEFARMYGEADVLDEIHDQGAWDVEKVRKGYAEMESRSWLYGQTPRFTFCTHPFEGDPRPRPDMSFDMRVHFEARQGNIEKFHVEDGKAAAKELSALQGATLHDVQDWAARLADAGLSDHQAGEVGSWLNRMLGTGFTKLSIDEMRP